MSISKSSVIVSSAILLALSTTAVHADEAVAKKSLSKEQKIGMATGATIGAFIAGPFGAGVGFIIGTMTGSGAEQVRNTNKYAKTLEQELAEAKLALAQVTEKSSGDPLFEQLAQQMRADVLFRTNSADLAAPAAVKLAELGAILAAYPNLVIELDGFADPRGKSPRNLELSQQRASAVQAALMVGGAQIDRIKIAAHGADLNTAPVGDLEAYAWERRVSLSIVPATVSKIAQAR
ncbi:MAG: OmpA family protein [Candidatus Obscuribacterales bacterium]|nr:OmpA family protein [Steroidobacteraceae bacterium]